MLRERMNNEAIQEINAKLNRASMMPQERERQQRLEPPTETSLLNDLGFLSEQPLLFRGCVKIGTSSF